MTDNTKLTQLEFSSADFAAAEALAARCGFKQWAYTSTSALIGLFCLPERQGQNRAAIIKTRELGFLVVMDAEDLNHRII